MITDNAVFGVTHGSAFSLQEIARRAKKIEDAGFDMFLLGDRPEFHDPFLSIGHALHSTQSLTVGSGIIAGLLYEPWIVKRALRTLQEAYDGRVFFAIAMGDHKVLEEHGVNRPRIPKLRKWFQLFHEWTGSEQNMDVPPELPVYLGTQSPKVMKQLDEFVNGYLLNTASVTEVRFLMQYTKKPIFAYGFALCPTFSKERVKVNLRIAELMLRSTSLGSLAGNEEIMSLVGAVKEKGLDWLSPVEREKVLREFTFFGDSSDIIQHVRDLLSLGVKGVVFAGLPDFHYEVLMKKIIQDV